MNESFLKENLLDVWELVKKHNGFIMLMILISIVPFTFTFFSIFPLLIVSRYLITDSLPETERTWKIPYKSEMFKFGMEFYFYILIYIAIVSAFIFYTIYFAPETANELEPVKEPEGRGFVYYFLWFIISILLSFFCIKMSLISNIQAGNPTISEELADRILLIKMNEHKDKFVKLFMHLFIFNFALFTVMVLTDISILLTILTLNAVLSVPFVLRYIFDQPIKRTKKVKVVNLQPATVKT